MIPFHAERKPDYGVRKRFDGGYLFLQAIYYRLDLNRVCRKIRSKHHFRYDLNVILADLIQSEVYKNSSFFMIRNDHILYYDCTNYYFENGQEDGDIKYGKSKENRPNPIIQMGLFTDGDGIPLAFSLFPGNQ